MSGLVAHAGLLLQPAATASKSHRYWRVYIPALSSGGDMLVGELILRGVVGGAAITGQGTPIAGNWFLGPSNPSFGPQKSFDGDPASYWLTMTAPTWIGYDFGTPVSVAEYGMVTSNYPGSMPNAWQLQGSSNATDWDTLDSRSGITWSEGVARYFVVP